MTRKSYCGNLLWQSGLTLLVRDVIKNREVSLVINTPSVKANSIEHLGRIRKACIKYKVPYLTTIAAAYAAAEGIEAAMSGKGEVKSLQEYHATIS